MWLKKMPHALSASMRQHFASPKSASYSPTMNSGKNAIAIASPTATRVYTSITRYADSV